MVLEDGTHISLSLQEPTEAYRTRALISLLRLHWFVRLRWVFVVAACGVLALERFVTPSVTRPWQLAVVIGGVALLNLVWMVTTRGLRARLAADEAAEAGPIGSAQLFANAQVACDLALLTLILRYTGGVENPMMMFYVFHIAIGALLLRKRQALLQCAWAIVLYASVAVGEMSGRLTPHYGFLPALPSPGWHDDAYYVVVAVGVMICGVLGVCYFTLEIAARLDKRDRQLLEANAALRRSTTAIQDLQMRRSRFMQNAAHQLKAPLAVIQTLASLIRDGIVPPEATRPTMEKIIQRCRDGIVQVTELLTLARVQEADPRRHRVASTSIAEVVTELCRRFKPIADGKNVTLNWVVPEGQECRAHVDPRDASDCIGNLIDNALKYTPGPGSVTVKVAAVASPHRQRRLMPGAPERELEDGFVYVTVKDTGFGLETGALADHGAEGGGSLFDAFRRGNNAVAAGIPGTGLGLSIVREVVEQAGGRIIVYSRPGRGSTFTVMFPTGRDPLAPLCVRDTRASEIITEHAEPGPDAVRSETSSEHTSC